jgi:hypothetical protein
MLLVGKGLGEDVCNHFICEIPQNNSFSSSYEAITNIVVLALNVFCGCAESRILREDNGHTIVAHKLCSLLLRLSYFLKKGTQPS